MTTGVAKVTFTLVDLSDVVGDIDTSVGAIVFYSDRGSTDIELMTTEAQFVTEYGSPAMSDLAKHCAIGFLQVGNQLYCKRVHNGALHAGIEIVTSVSSEVNAAIASGAATISGTITFGTDGLLDIFAKDPGDWGDDLSAIVDNIDSTDHTFDVTVYEKDSDSVYQQVEFFEGCSRVSAVDGYGNQRYVEDRVNGVSSYIIIRDNTAVASTVDPKAQATQLVFDEGDDGSTITDTQIVNGWDEFLDTSQYPVNILINGGYTGSAVQVKMISVASTRGDALAVLDVPLASTGATDVVSFRDGTSINSRYGAMYAPWIKIFDSYNGATISIPPSGDVASIYVRTDAVYGGAFGAPAGYNRGILSRCLGLVYNAPTKLNYTAGEQDSIDVAQVNVLSAESRWGIIVKGENTLQTKKSALSQVHISRLMLQIAKQVQDYAKPYLFEPLLDRTYLRVKTALETYMDRLSGAGALDTVDDAGYKVICDSTNNTGADRERQILNIWINVKPVQVAKYIVIKVAVIRNSANVEAIVLS